MDRPSWDRLVLPHGWWIVAIVILLNMRRIADSVICSCDCLICQWCKAEISRGISDMDRTENLLHYIGFRSFVDMKNESIEINRLNYLLSICQSPTFDQSTSNFGLAAAQILFAWIWCTSRHMKDRVANIFDSLLVYQCLRRDCQLMLCYFTGSCLISIKIA